MKIFSKKHQIKSEIQSLISKNYTFGLVPTMGALHAGHLALVKRALNDNDMVVVSIFVNPTQFNNTDDLIKYPRTLDDDVALLNTLSAANIFVYAPSVDDVYEGSTKSDAFYFDGLEHQMEGKFRTGHFDGVGTIVKRLFEIVTPNKAYFGEKDFQQLQIIRKLVETFNFPIQIVGCDIEREPSGLALSSRNTRLKLEYKKASPFIYETLKTAKLHFGTKSAKEVTQWVESQFNNHDLLKLEYFIIANETTLKTIKRKTKNNKYRAFIAVYADDVRLIDNIALN